MPLKEEDAIAREPGGGFNEKYCRWYFIDGKYAGPDTIEEMIEACMPHMGGLIRKPREHFYKSSCHNWSIGAVL